MARFASAMGSVRTCLVLACGVLACARSVGLQAPDSDIGDCIEPTPVSVRACGESANGACTSSAPSPFVPHDVELRLEDSSGGVLRSWKVQPGDPWRIDDAPRGQGQTLVVVVRNAYDRVVCDGRTPSLDVDGDVRASVRLSRTPFEDRDGDGVADADENAMGLDPDNPDSDADGASDGDEIIAGLDATVACSTCVDGSRIDCDDDRLSNDAEFLACTDPEVTDTDGDGIEDGLEDRNANGRVDENETDPKHADTDGDGVRDGDERARDSDPLDPLVADSGGIELDFEPSDVSIAPDGATLAVVSRVMTTGTELTSFVELRSRLTNDILRVELPALDGAPLLVVPWNGRRVPTEPQVVMVVAPTAVGAQNRRTTLSVIGGPSTTSTRTLALVDEAGDSIGRVTATAAIVLQNGFVAAFGTQRGLVYVIDSETLESPSPRTRRVENPMGMGGTVQAMALSGDGADVVALSSSGRISRMRPDTSGVIRVESTTETCVTCFTDVLAPIPGTRDVLIGGWSATGTRFLIRSGIDDDGRAPQQFDMPQSVADIAIGRDAQRAYVLGTHPSPDRTAIMVVALNEPPFVPGTIIENLPTPGGDPRHLAMGDERSEITVVSALPNGAGRLEVLTLSQRLRSLFGVRTSRRSPETDGVGINGRPNALWLSPCGTRALITTESQPFDLFALDTDLSSPAFLRPTDPLRTAFLTLDIVVSGTETIEVMGRDIDVAGRPFARTRRRCVEQGPVGSRCANPTCWDGVTRIDVADGADVEVDNAVAVGELDGDVLFLRNDGGVPTVEREGEFSTVPRDGCGAAAVGVGFVDDPNSVVVHLRGPSDDCIVRISAGGDVVETFGGLPRISTAVSTQRHLFALESGDTPRDLLRIDASGVTSVATIAPGLASLAVVPPPRSSTTCDEEVVVLHSQTAPPTGYLTIVDPCAQRVVRRAPLLSGVLEDPLRLRLQRSTTDHVLWVPDPGGDVLGLSIY